MGWRCPEEYFTSPYVNEYGEHNTYRLRPAKEFLKGYKHQYLVTWKQYSIATIAYAPTDTRITSFACAIKLSNPLLYIYNWRFFLYDILRTLKWTPISITRADFCVDFNKFAGGIRPLKFLRMYVQPASSRFPSYLRVGSNKFCAYGIKRIDSTDYQSVRWGSRESGVSTYIYNKSLELATKKAKPWIVNAWKDAGLVVDNPHLPVWRIEFSVTSKGLSLLDKNTGELSVLETRLFDTSEKVRDICRIYAQKYFRFRLVPPTGTARPKYAKDLPEVKLLDFSFATSIKPITLCRATDSGRTERMISRRLFALADDLDDYSILGHFKLHESIPAVRRTAEVYDEVAALKDFRNSIRLSNEQKPTDHRLDDEYIEAVHHLAQRTRDRNIIHQQLVNDMLAKALSRSKGMKL